MFSKHRTFFLSFILVLAMAVFGVVAHAQSDESQADIAIESLIVNPTSIRYTIRNIGTETYMGQANRTVAWLDAANTVVASRTTLSYLNLGPGTTRNIDVASVNYPAPPITATRMRVSFVPSLPELNSVNNSTEANRPLPDLVIENPTFTWNSGSFTVRNVGTASWYGLYRTRYEWLDAAGAVLETNGGLTPTLTLAPNGATSHILPVGFMTSLPDGAVKVRLTIDADATVVESNETNNSLELNRVFPAVDLRPYVIFLYRDSIDYSIINIGDAAFNENLGVSFTWLDAAGADLTTHLVSNAVTLNSGYSGGDEIINTDDFIANPPSGAVRMRVTIDPENNFNESDETNNSLTVNRRLPDLEVSSFGLSSDGLFFRIRNNGEDNYVGAVPVRLVWLGSGDSELAVSELTYSVNLSGMTSADYDLSPVFNLASPFVITVPAGAERFRIAINSDHSIVESTYDNNSRTVAPAFPDLIVTNPAWGDGRLTFTVNNISDRGVNARYNRTLLMSFNWLDDAGATLSNSNLTQSVNIPAGQGVPISITVPAIINPPIRGARLRITVNPLSEINELSFTNNSADIARATFPDGTIESPSINPDDESVSFTARNLGTAPLAGLLTTRYAWLDGSGVEISSFSESALFDLDPGESVVRNRNNSFVINPPEAARQLKIEFNPLHGAALAESNYENNTAQANRPLPDLTLSAPYLNQTSVSFAVNNIGSFRHNFITNFRFAWLDTSGNEISNHPYTRVINLAPGSSQSVVVPVSTVGDYITDVPTGAVRLKITINSNQGHPESNFDNNTVEVAPSFPDFIVESASLSASGAALTIKNIGLSARSGVIRYQLQWLDQNRNPIGGSSPVLIIASSTIAPGASITYTDPGPYSLSAGTNRAFLRVTLNPENLFLESNYSNNSFEIPKPLPDLTALITSLGDTTVEYTISNLGHWTIAENVGIVLEWIDIDGLVVGSLALTTRLDLAPNESRNTSYIGPFITVPANNSVALRIAVNPTHTVTEESFDNNISAEFSRSIPDLSIENPLLTDTGLSYSLVNLGSRRIDMLVRTLYEWVDGNGVALDSRSGQRSTQLDPGQSYVANSNTYSSTLENFIRTSPASGAQLRITVDYDDTLDESNEANNSVTIVSVAADATGEDLANEDEEEVASEIAAAADGETAGETSDGQDSSQDQNQTGRGNVQTDSKDLDDVSSSEKFRIPRIETSPKANLIRPRVLPGNIFYGVKNLGQEIRAAFTFDDGKRANLRLQYANQRILDTHFLVEDGKFEQAVEHLERYQRDVRKVQEAIVEVSKSEPISSSNESRVVANSAKLSNRLLGDEIKHQVLLGRFERRANKLNDIDSIEALRAVRQETSKDSAEIMTKLPERMVKNILNESLNQNGTPFKVFRNLEVLQFIKETAPVAAKNIIENVAQAQEQKFADNLLVATPQLRSRFAPYVDQAGGNEVSYLKVSDALSSKVQDEEVKKDLAKGQDKLFSRIEEKVKIAATKGVEVQEAAQKSLFRDLRDGTIDDLRTIEVIQDRLGQSVEKISQEAKKESLENTRKMVNENSSKVIQDWQKESAKHADDKQVKVLDNIFSVLPITIREEVNKIKQIISNVEDVKKEKDLEDIKNKKSEDKRSGTASDQPNKVGDMPEKKTIPPQVIKKSETTKSVEKKVKPLELPKQEEDEILPAKTIEQPIVNPVELTKPLVTEPTSSNLENIVKPIEMVKPTEAVKVIEPIKTIEPIKEATPVIETAPTKATPIIVEPIKTTQPISEPTKETAVTTTTVEKTINQNVEPVISAPTSATIKINNSTFSPASITVSPGAKITIVNADKLTHALSGSVSSPSIKPGASVIITAPSKPGNYSYTCPYHSLMRGEVIVK